MRLIVNGVALDLAAEEFPPEGLLLLDLAEQGRIDLESSCRSASCGTCLVRVCDGAEHLSGPTAAERELLPLVASAEDHRLGCQARLLPSGPGRCVLATPD